MMDVVASTDAQSAIISGLVAFAISFGCFVVARLIVRSIASQISKALGGQVNSAPTDKEQS